MPERKKKPGSKPKMHRMRRLLFKKLAKARKAVKTASTINKLSTKLQQVWELEEQLLSDYNASNNKEEDEAVLRIRQNPKAFF